jgi:hypothetical protein
MNITYKNIHRNISKDDFKKAYRLFRKNRTGLKFYSFHWSLGADIYKHKFDDLFMLNSTPMRRLSLIKAEKLIRIL